MELFLRNVKPSLRLQREFVSVVKLAIPATVVRNDLWPDNESVAEERGKVKVLTGNRFC